MGMRKLIEITIAIPEEKYQEIYDDAQLKTAENCDVIDIIRENLIPVLGEDFRIFWAR